VTEEPPSAAGNRLDNREAVSYSLRLFLFGYIALPTVIWAIFLALVYDSPAFSSEEFSAVLLTVIWLAIMVVGYFLTLGRTPREITFVPPHTLVLKPWVGRDRLLKTTPESYFMPLEAYGRSVFAPMRCELIDIRRLEKGTRRIVAEEGLMENVLPRGDKRA
jgi:hypothetical protein